MTYKKAGRPKTVVDKKRDKVIRLKLTTEEHNQFLKKARGFVSASDFMRTRLFYDSTLQQVQPEVFIQTLKDFLTVLRDTKTVMSESLSVIKGRVGDGDISLEESFKALMELYKKQIKCEKEIATYMQRMLKAGRKSEI